MLKFQDDERIVGEDIPSVAIRLDSEDATLTITPSSPVPQILESQQIPSSQWSNSTLSSALEQEQLSLEPRVYERGEEREFPTPNQKSSTDINDSSSDSEPLKEEEISSAEIIIPQLKSKVIDPGQGEAQAM